MSGLPQGWTSAQLAALLAPNGLFSDGDWVESKDQDPNGVIRLLQLADIGDGFFIDKSNRFINAAKFEELRCTELFESDVLIARMPDPLGRACLMPKLPQRCITVVDVAVFRPGSNGVQPQWLMHTINAPQLRAEIELNSSGTTRKRISRGNLSAMLLPIPPLPEQKRIADKLDTVLARVDACRDRLDRIPALLKRFRQSVLAAATSGKLTEDWREATELDLTLWREEPFGLLIHEMRNGLSPKPTEQPPGAKILRISAVRQGKVDFDDYRFLVVDQATRQQYGLQQDDLLFTRYNGSLEFLGVCALVSIAQPDYVYPDKLIRVRVNKQKIAPKFVELAFGSHFVRRQVEDFVKSSAGQKGISGGDLKTTEIPIPPLDEQHEIVRRVETLFAFADRLEARYATARKQVEQLTPALLAKAFRGELVAQDPNDEPAAELLKRLAAQREIAPKARRGRKGA
ncbi:MAG: hypothetical protein H6R07_1591 [Proteobacteria bacterium]|nr:hypothetical protein [Pseudomonadota bacterium]